jgi:hypothetical protein
MHDSKLPTSQPESEKKEGSGTPSLLQPKNPIANYYVTSPKGSLPSCTTTWDQAFNTKASGRVLQHLNYNNYYDDISSYICFTHLSVRLLRKDLQKCICKIKVQHMQHFDIARFSSQNVLTIFTIFISVN